MNYLPMMTEDEIKYVCSAIPLQETVLYFKQYPKDFAKVMPGFRATSLKNQEQISAVLFRNRNQKFVFSFLEKHISRWLDNIQKEIVRLINGGENKESAWLQTLPFCYFVDDISIFFKLTGEELSEDILLILNQSIRKIKDLDTERKNLEKSLGEKKLEHARLEDDIKRVQANLDKMRKKSIERFGEMETLKRTNADLQKQVEVLRANEQIITDLDKTIQQRDQTISMLKTKLTIAMNEQQQLEIKIRNELEQHRAVKKIEQSAVLKPRCPKEIDEFRDYFGYNIENLGVETGTEYYQLLKDYLCEILFTGKPILINRNTGFSLIKCVANALVSSPTVATLVYNTNITVEAIEEFLSASNRIMFLDNFVGNFNETILITICDKHKDKILFISVAYDKTLRFVPEEFLKYCHYINVNRIPAFTKERDLSEDPSSVEETEAIVPIPTTDTFWSTLLKEIMIDFGIGNGLATYKSLQVSDEASLCRLLAFDLLPYCADVLNISPFSISDRFNKYSDNKGRCPYKELFRRWFLD